jgi:hypothetical protein
MTPKYETRGMLNEKFAYEVCSGNGMDRSKIYGITVLGLTSKDVPFRADKLNKLTRSIKETSQYIDHLRSIMKRYNNGSKIND